MEATQVAFLTSNFYLLSTRTVNVNSLMEFLVCRNVLSPAERGSIMIFGDNKIRSFLLYELLLAARNSVASNAFEILVDGLHQTGNGPLVDTLFMVTPPENFLTPDAFDALMYGRENNFTPTPTTSNPASINGSSSTPKKKKKKNKKAVDSGIPPLMETSGWLPIPQMQTSSAGLHSIPLMSLSNEFLDQRLLPMPVPFNNSQQKISKTVSQGPFNELLQNGAKKFYNIQKEHWQQNNEIIMAKCVKPNEESLFSNTTNVSKASPIKNSLSSNSSKKTQQSQNKTTVPNLPSSTKATSTQKVESKQNYIQNQKPANKPMKKVEKPKVEAQSSHQGHSKSQNVKIQPNVKVELQGSKKQPDKLQNVKIQPWPVDQVKKVDKPKVESKKQMPENVKKQPEAKDDKKKVINEQDKTNKKSEGNKQSTPQQQKTSPIKVFDKPEIKQPSTQIKTEMSSTPMKSKFSSLIAALAEENNVVPEQKKEEASTENKPKIDTEVKESTTSANDSPQAQTPLKKKISHYQIVNGKLQLIEVIEEPLEVVTKQYKPKPKETQKLTKDISETQHSTENTKEAEDSDETKQVSSENVNQTESLPGDDDDASSNNATPEKKKKKKNRKPKHLRQLNELEASSSQNETPCKEEEERKSPEEERKSPEDTEKLLQLLQARATLLQKAKGNNSKLHSPD